MTGLRGRTAIVGIGETPVGRLQGSSSFEMASLVAGQAIEDAGLTLEEVDGLICGGSLVDDTYMYAARLAARLGVAPQYSTVLPLGGSTFCHALIEAELVIGAGLAHTVLVVAADRLLSGLGPQGSINRFEAFQDPDLERPYGFMMPAVYAMAARRHMHLYGTTREQLAQVAVSARRHAGLNPLAQYRRPLSILDVVTAPEVASPLGLFDCSPISDGAGAFIVVAGDRARSLAKKPVYVLGAAEAHAHEYSNGQREITQSPMEPCGKAVFGATGLHPSDVDFAEIYDCFTITVLVTLEDLGFCPKGEVGAFVEGGTIELGGLLPVNTHGGLLSHGHPGTPAGIFHVIEAVKQIRREVEPERQVTAPRIGLVSGNSGMLRDMAAVLLGEQNND
jgi:acetyl-CoA acetyltransferase